MKILYIVSHLRKGGPTDVLYNICSDIIKKVSITIVCLRKETPNSDAHRFKELGATIISLKKSYLKCEFCYQNISKAAQQIVEQEHIDLVHCHGYHPVLVGSKLKNVRVISTLHNRASEDFINVFGNIAGRYMLKKYYKALNKFSLNIAVSKSAEELYKQNLKNVTYINNGINTNIYQPVKAEKVTELREEYNIPQDATVLISTGRIEPEKRVESLIQWFNNISCNNKHLFLIVVGDGSKLPTCKELAKNASNILFTGRISNVVDYLQLSNFYISNSKSEGMSMAVCEGIACGLIPILSSIPSHHDVGDDINALFFEDIATVKLPSSIEINKEELHNYILKNFSCMSMCSAYKKEYGL